MKKANDVDTLTHDLLAAILLRMRARDEADGEWSDPVQDAKEVRLIALVNEP